MGYVVTASLLREFPLTISNLSPEKNPPAIFSQMKLLAESGYLFPGMLAVGLVFAFAVVYCQCHETWSAYLPFVITLGWVWLFTLLGTVLIASQTARLAGLI